MSEPTRPRDRTLEGAGTAQESPARVLVADDEDGTLVLITTMLTYAGFTVIGARDGREALLRAREAAPDLALLDVMMPGLDGREVCRRITSDPDLLRVPVILHSSADERDIDWRECGAVAFMRKPFSVREIPELVRRYLQARTEADRLVRPRLTDEEIQEIARQIRDAVRQPPARSPRDAVLSPSRQLSPEDEARVEAAVMALFQGDAPGTHQGRGDDDSHA